MRPTGEVFEMSWLFLGIIVLFGTAVWSLGRWALKDNAEPGVVEFWVSLTVAVACGVATAVTGDWRGAPSGVWLPQLIWGRNKSRSGSFPATVIRVTTGPQSMRRPYTAGFENFWPAPQVRISNPEYDSTRKLAHEYPRTISCHHEF